MQKQTNFNTRNKTVSFQRKALAAGSTTILKNSWMLVLLFSLKASCLMAQSENTGELSADGGIHTIEATVNAPQDFRIPDNPDYKYIYFHAEGGDGGKRQVKEIGGKTRHTVKAGAGATIMGTFKIGTGKNMIPPGSTVRFLVGNKGASKTKQNMAGADGGAGTAVFVKKPDKNWHMLLVAGGGGGAYSDCCSLKSEGKSAETGRNGSGGKGAKAGGGGKDGGRGGTTKSANPGAGAFAGYEYEGVAWPGGAKDKTKPPLGNNDADGNNYGPWGFAGGGLGNSPGAGGGGGGYSGGGAGALYKGGGGGGSYVNEDMATNVVKIKNGTTGDTRDGFVRYQFLSDVDKPFSIRTAQKYKKCIGVVHAETANGTDIRMWVCQGNADQRWFFKDNRLVSALGLSKCLDLADNKTGNGTNIRLWDCNDSNAQRWIYDGLSRQIRNLGNWQKCLDEANANIRIWDCRDMPNQQWKINAGIPIAIGSEGDTRIKTIHLAKDDGKCINLDGANTDNKTSNIHLYDCTGYGAQKWLFDGINIRYYGQQNKCVDLAYNKTDNGTNIRLWDCNGSDAQHWVYDGLTGTIRYWKNPDKCLVKNGTNIEIRDCNGSGYQRWEIKDADTPFGSDKVMSIKRFIDDKKCLDVDGGKTTNGTNIQLGDCTGNTNQQWTYDGLYLRYKKDPSKCLDLKAANTHRGNNIQLYTCNSTKAQRWLYDQKEHKIRYADNWGKCLEVYKDINKAGTNIQIYDCRDTDAQRWIMK